MSRITRRLRMKDYMKHSKNISEELEMQVIKLQLIPQPDAKQR